jgi:signal peptidase II
LKFQLPSPKAHLIFWPLMVAGVVLDLWSKQAVFNWLSTRPANESVLVHGFLKLVMRENSGAAFSIAIGQTPLLIAVSIVALIVMVAVFLFGDARQKVTQVALSLFTAGIIGNLYDRVFNDGFVRDFVDVVYWPGKHWPAFNVADSMLCVGVGLLIISNLTSASSQKPAHRQK